MESIWIMCAIAVYGVLPVLLIWGWMRWASSSQPRTAPAIMACVSFALTNLSALLALGTVFYAWFVRPFPYYDRVLMKIYGCGMLLSLAAFVIALGGVWRPSPVRWHAPLVALGMLTFWVRAASSE
jgi:hypothetical protein